MKFRTILLGTLLLASVATLSAQNALPNPHDDSCWSSLAALRACQIQAYDQAQAYAQNCTSYPEYQCFDYYQPQQKVTKGAAKSTSHQDTSPEATSIPPVSAGTTQTAGAN